jgi:hypothetical protein
VAVVTILNWRTEVGDGRWGEGGCHAAGKEREREGERGGPGQPASASGVARPCRVIGRTGEGADRWATTTVPGGGTG